jgi:hypothetical protein
MIASATIFVILAAAAFIGMWVYTWQYEKGRQGGA